MKYKIKLGLLENILNSFVVLSEKQLPIKVSYKLSKLIKLLSKEYGIFEESRLKLVNIYGEKDEKGELKVRENGLADIIEDKRNDFNRDYNDLINLEIEIEFDQFSIDDFGDISIAPKDLINIGLFIKDLN